MDYEVILFDFDWVLCEDYFYNNLLEHYPHVSEYIQTKIFRGNSDIPDLWMKNIMSMNDVNKHISDNTWIELKLLSNLFEESVKNMKINKGLLSIASQLKKQWRKIALVTNNMDVFDKITVPHNTLHEVFPIIINSCNYGVLKHEENGKLFDIVMGKLWHTEYNKVLLIDDSKKARETFEKKWWKTFAYSTFDEFYLRAKNNLSIQ